MLVLEHLSLETHLTHCSTTYPSQPSFCRMFRLNPNCLLKFTRMYNKCLPDRQYETRGTPISDAPLMNFAVFAILPKPALSHSLKNGRIKKAFLQVPVSLSL